MLVGYNQEKKHNKYHWVGRKNLIDNDTPQINLAYGDTSTSGSESMWATNGIRGEVLRAIAQLVGQSEDPRILRFSG